MSRLLLLSLMMVFFCACNSQTEESNQEQEKPAVVKKVSQTVNQQVAKRDTNIPKTPRHSYIIDQARPKDQIDQKFPFDIDMKTIAGDVKKSSEIIGSENKPTIMLFWLTTCYPCRMELDAIDKVYDSWQEETDFNMVVVSTDFQKNFGNFVDRVEEEKWKWTTYHDMRREFRHVMPGGLNGLPQVFVFNSKGEIVYHKRKYYSGDELKLYEAVKKAG